jgi:branched-chain amino acid transport system ATP-binding protein
MLEVNALCANYGRGEVLRDVSMRVDGGALVGILGANGAGKSTLALAISGMTRITAGYIRFEGKSLAGLSPERIVELGLVQVAQGRPVFRNLTVEENLRVGAYPRRARGRLSENLRQVEQHFPILRERRGQQAGLLSGGEQQMLLIGRALMACPSMLLLDEPSLGLAPKIVSAIFASIRRLNAEGLTVLVAEQNARQVLASASTVYLLETGRVRACGPADQMRNNPSLKAAYLGLV